MAYRALTISRQFGSGGAAIARRIAERRGWTLLDARIITEVAHQAGVDVVTARERDERVDSWFHQFNRGGFQALATAAGAMLGPNEFFDAEAVAALSQGIVERAYAEGNCVIVGRGAQCILDGRPDVFRVFVYGSERERLRRIRTRVPSGAGALHQTVLSKKLGRLQPVRDDDQLGSRRAGSRVYDRICHERRRPTIA